MHLSAQKLLSRVGQVYIIQIFQVHLNRGKEDFEPLLELRNHEIAWPETSYMVGGFPEPEEESPVSFFLQAVSLLFVLV